MAANQRIKFGIDYEVNSKGLDKLKKDLLELKNVAREQIGLDKSLKPDEAKAKIRQVKQEINALYRALDESTNKDLGVLNVTQFNSKLKELKQTMPGITKNLTSLGSQGRNAFRDLNAQVLTTTSVFKENHAVLDKIGTTLKNSIKWTAASSAINSVTGSVQKAYSYVRDLDESLSHIRIITGQSAEEMAKFAKQANIAAQSLGTTTTAYTDAALIYYQQGLSNEEVQARTEVTLKMANVLGESASQVSDYMTAIWNNFDDGSHTMEHYADVITALGATTAASSEEIAEGLEKFASVAEASGLSYEYATSALATVVAKTRQSADSVGTSFKTIFARIQGLNLGETLDDGTTLNKYSKALAQVGISIKDQNGELKNMDAILNEMGSKWQNLNKDQQLALAQTVAGTRQYNQLVSLMENWDDVLKNVNTANDANGTLMEQQERYSESLEAHLKSLKAAQQDFYSSLFDSDSFKSMIDALTNLQKVFTGFINSIGGGGTAFLALGSIATRVFENQIANSIAISINNLKMNSKAVQENIDRLDIAKNLGVPFEKINENVINTYKEFSKYSKFMSDDQKAMIKDLILEQTENEKAKDTWNEKAQKAVEFYNKINPTDQIDSSAVMAIDNRDEQQNPTISTFDSANMDNFFESIQKVDNAYKDFSTQLKGLNNVIDNHSGRLIANKKLYKDVEQSLTNEDQKIKRLKDTIEGQASALGLEEASYENVSNAMADYEQKLAAVEVLNKDAKATKEQKEQAYRELVESIRNIETEYQKFQTVLGETEQRGVEANETIAQAVNGANTNIENSVNKTISDLQKLKDALKMASDIKAFITGLRSFGQALSAINSLRAALKNFQDESISTTDRVLSLLSSISFAIPMIIDSVKGLISSFRIMAQVIVQQVIPAVLSFIATPIGAVITATAVAIAAVVSIAVIAASKINSLGKQQEILAENTKNLTDAFNEAKNASKELNDQIADYKDGRDALETLSDKTEEFRQKLEETNTIAKEMIATFGLIQDKDWHFDGDKIVIKDEALERLKKAKEEAQYQAEQDLYSSQIVENGLKKVNRVWITPDTRNNQGEEGRYTIPEELERLYSNAFSMMTQGFALSTTVGDSGLSIGTILDNYADYSQKDGIKQQNEEVDKENEKILRDYQNSYIKQNFSKDFLENAKKIYGEEDGSRKSSYMISAAAKLTANSQNIQNMQKELENVSVSKNVDTKGRLNSYLKEQEADFQINNDLELEKKYAELVLKKSKEEIDAYTVKDKHLIDEKGNNIITVSKEQMRNAIALDIAKDKIIEKYNQQNNEAIENVEKELSTFGKEAEDFANKYGIDISESVYNAIANGNTKLDFTSLWGNLAPDDAEILKGLSIEEIAKNFESVDFKALGYKGGESFAAEFQAALKNYSAMDYWNNQLKEVDKNLSNVTNFEDKLKTGKATEEDMTQLKELEAEYPKLAAIQDKTSKEYLNQLKLIKEELENQKILIEEEKQKLLIDELGNIDIKIEADDTDFRNKMKEIAEQEYEVLVSIKSDMQTDFDDAVSAMEEIEKAAAMIGDDFIVNAENLEELNDIFPGILAGMEFVGDGTVKLQEDIANGAMAAAKMEADAVTQSATQKILAEADVLAQKRDAAIAIADIAAKQTKGSAIDADNQKKITTALNTFKSDANAKQVKVEKNNNKVQADDAAESATSMTRSYGEAYKQMANDAVTWGQIAHDALVYGSDKTAEMPASFGTIKDITGTEFQTTSTMGVTGDAEVLTEDDLKDSENIDWKGVEEYYRQLASSYDKAYNNALGKVAEINARATKIGKTATKDGNSNKDIMEFLNKEKTLYHDLDEEIKHLSTDMSKLQKEQSRLNGQELLDNLNEQLALLKNQNAAYADKIALVKEDIQLSREALESQGVSFTEDGYISNYSAVIKAREDYINGLIEAYNNMSAKEQKAQKETIEHEKKLFEQFKKDISEYEKLIDDTLPDLESKIIDTLDKEIEIKISKFQMSMKMRLDLTSAEKEWNAFRKKMLGDKLVNVGNAREALENYRSYYREDGRGQIQQGAERTNTILEELRKMDAGEHSDIYSAYDEATNTWVDNREKALADLKDSYSQLMTDLETIEDLVKQADDAFLSSIDKVAEAYELQHKTLEFFGNQIQHDMKMIEMTYGSKAYAQMDTYYKKQLANTEKQKDALQGEVDYWEQKMIMAREAGDEDAYKKYRDNWMESINSLNSAIESWAEALRSEYENTINSIIDSMNKSITNGKGLEYVGEEWELINKNAENYLDNINAAYEIQSLQGKWTDAINKTSNITVQQKLNKLMNDQLTMLREKDKLTKYDIERANLEYDLELKKIALQEAQMNKSTMRLRRDENGNYSYQFTADQDSVAKAQQDVAAAQNALYNFDKEAYKNNLDELYSTVNEFQQKLAELYLDADLTDEERIERKRLLEEQYGEKINFLTSQNLNIRNNLESSAFDSLAMLYNEDVNKFKNMSELERNILMTELVPQWQSGIQEMSNAIGENGFQGTFQSVFSSLEAKADEFNAKQREIAGISEEISRRVQEQQQMLEGEADLLIDKYRQESEVVGELRRNLQELGDVYDSVKRKAVDAAEAAYKYYAAAKNQQLTDEEISRMRENLKTGGNYSGSGYVPGNSDGSGNSGGLDADMKYYVIGYNGKDAQWIKVTNETWDKKEAAEKWISENGFNLANTGVYNLLAMTGEELKKDKIRRVLGFDTGGYTGSWDSSGRLALLHQKELVLNASDTKNFLDAVSIVRDISSKLDLSSLINKIPNVSTSIINRGDELTQTVYIEAKFEGQTEAVQIEQALSNLVNTASQRIYKSGR